MQAITKLSQINEHLSPALSYVIQLYYLRKPARKYLVREKSRPQKFKEWTHVYSTCIIDICFLPSFVIWSGIH